MKIYRDVAKWEKSYCVSILQQPEEYYSGRNPIHAYFNMHYNIRTSYINSSPRFYIPTILVIKTQAPKGLIKVLSVMITQEDKKSEALESSTGLEWLKTRPSIIIGELHVMTQTNAILAT
jgi:hypothetical protein